MENTLVCNCYTITIAEIQLSIKKEKLHNTIKSFESFNTLKKEKHNHKFSSRPMNAPSRNMHQQSMVA